jgi:hypothetical protein
MQGWGGKTEGTFEQGQGGSLLCPRGRCAADQPIPAMHHQAADQGRQWAMRHNYMHAYCKTTASSLTRPVVFTTRLRGRRRAILSRRLHD